MSKYQRDFYHLHDSLRPEINDGVKEFDEMYRKYVDYVKSFR